MDPHAINPHIDPHTKYDRQIRLWAHAGQARLQQAHICLINANAAGAETLKNLVLPGVGAFTIVDSSVVCADDLSGNFFLEERHLNTGTARAMTECLQELNPDVEGHFVESSLESALDDPRLWDQYTVVVVSGYVDPASLQRLKDILWQKNTPLLRLATSGFYGFLHVLARETAIVDTHDPSKTYDLRIDCPWPELAEYCSAFDMDSLDDTEHAHVPYIVIFIKALDQWKHDHGSVPQNYAQKRQFRSQYVENMARSMAVETNFIEAAQSVHRALQVTQVPNSIERLFERAESSERSDFWLHVRALKRFVTKYGGKVPLPGNIPDMASTTSSYVQLQGIYRKKADTDRANFTAELTAVYAEAGRSPTDICDGYVASFCKNAAFLFVTNGSGLLYSDTLLAQLRTSDNSSDSAHELAIYFGILALHSWMGSGQCGGVDAFIGCFEDITSIPRAGFSSVITNTLTEIFTHNVASYHNICSLLGGVAGQEVLKIATAQYIPLDNVYVFNGVQSTSSKFKV